VCEVDVERVSDLWTKTFCETTDAAPKDSDSLIVDQVWFLNM